MISRRALKGSERRPGSPRGVSGGDADASASRGAESRLVGRLTPSVFKGGVRSAAASLAPAQRAGLDDEFTRGGVSSAVEETVGRKRGDDAAETVDVGEMRRELAVVSGVEAHPCRMLR